MKYLIGLNGTIIHQISHLHKHHVQHLITVCPHWFKYSTHRDVECAHLGVFIGSKKHTCQCKRLNEKQI